MKKFISIVLFISLMFTYYPSVFADEAPDRYDNVIYSQDFSDFKYSVNDFDSVYKGRYIVLSATAENGALSVKNGNRFIYETHELTERRMISGGVIKIEADFVFTDLSKGAKIMATYKNGGSSDGDATGCAYMLRSTSDKTVILKAYDKNGNAVTHTIDKSIETNKKYTYAIYMDLDSGRIQAQAGGANVLMGEELYMSKNLYTKNENGDFSNANINRLFETRSDNGGEYTIDNIRITKEAKLPVSNYIQSTEPLFQENFETFKTSDYTAAYVGADKTPVSTSNNIVDFNKETGKEDTDNHGNIFKLSSARLIKQLSGEVSGKYSVKADMYFTNAASNGIALSVNAKDSSKTATRLRIQDGYLRLQQGSSTNIAGFKYELNKWYTVEIIFDTQTLTVSALSNGTVFAAGKMNELSSFDGAYTRIFENDNVNLSIDGVYIDNVSITCNNSINYVDGSKYKTDIVNENFDLGTLADAYTNLGLTNPTVKEGKVQFNSGMRMIKNYSATEGIYVIDTDILISDFGTQKKNLFGPSGWAESGYQHLFDIYSQPLSNGTGKIGLRAFNKQGQNSDINDFVTDLKENEWINIKVAFNIDSGRIHTYVNGIETLVDRELYCFNWDNEETEEKEQIKVTRIYDFDNRTTGVKYSIDNLRAYRDTFSEAINIESGFINSKTINLPNKIGENKLYWYSHSEYITIDGYTANIALGTNSTAKFPEIEVIAQDKCGKISKSFIFCLTGSGLNLSGIPKETTTHINNLPFISSDGRTLIEWTSSHPEIITDTGAVTRPKNTTTVTLTAKCSEIEKSVDVVVKGMNEDNKIFVTKNKLYADNVLVAGKSNINGKKVEFKGNIHNGTQNDINVTPIIALYKDDVLQSIVPGTEQTIKAKNSGSEMTLDVTVPADGNYKVQAMMWNMDNLSPISISTNTDDKKATLFVIAASTYQDWTNEGTDPTQGGIGMYLGDYIDDNITVVNKAKAGRSSRSYLTEGRLNEVLSLAVEGDYALICWGGNDSTISRPNRYVSIKDYPKFLDVYRRATLDRGLIPFYVNGTYHGTYIPATETTPSSIKYDSIYKVYSQATIDYANSVNIPVADLYTAHGEYLATLTPDEVRAEFITEYDSDGTANNSFVHFNKTSADNMAKILSGLIKEANINGLSGYVKE